jgi:polyphenol oxidase
MITETESHLAYYSFEIFDGAVDQGIFTRRGGVSPEPWASLNTGGLNGDPRENVIENRQRIFDVFARPVASIFDVWQVHSADVIATQKPRPLDQAHKKADAIITSSHDVTLFMRFGDCVPVFLYDPIKKVAAIAHAGWQGTLKKVCDETVKAMVIQYGSRVENILAGIGPSICVDHYEVGDEVISRAREALGSDASEALVCKNRKMHFDLWAANRIVLESAGILHAHIQISAVCTAADVTNWYSHRAEKGKTGRFGALLGIK